VLARTAYLNTGTAGPWPTPVVEAIAEVLRQEGELGRASPRGLPDFPPTLTGARERLASWVGAGPGEVALVGSTTIGINMAVWGLDWQPGDEVVTTSVEHRGVLAPLRQLAARREVRVREAAVAGGEVETLAAIVGEMSERTRLVALSHVSFSTGARLPIRDIADAAHAAGARVLVDGAQAVGAMPVDVHGLGVDFYAFPGQKWLCGPEGTGGLYIRDVAALQKTFVGARSGQSGAAGYEYSTLFRPAVHGLLAALQWLDGIGREAIFARVADVADYCYARLSAEAGFEMVTPESTRAGLVHVRMPGVDLEASVARLAEAGLTVRSVPDTRSLRISCGFFNTRAEIDRLVDALSRARAAY
jgi:L-cysteine/cystine lyase